MTGSSRSSESTAAKARKMVRLIKSRYRLGRNAIEQGRSTKSIATSMGRCNGLASKVKKFARTFTPEEVEAVCAMRRRNGLPLSFAHLLPLLSVQDSGTRRAIALEAVERNLSGQDLQRRVKDFTANSSNPDGRRLRQPSDLLNGLERACSESRLTRRRLDQMRTMLGNLTDEQRSQSVPRDVAEEAKRACTELSDECGRLSAVFDRCLGNGRQPPGPENAAAS